MYPSFYEFFKYTFGIELEIFRLVQTFGFFMVLAFLSAAVYIGRAFEFLEKNQELSGKVETETVGVGPTILGMLGNLLFGFAIGYKFVYILSNLDRFTTEREAILFSYDGSILGGIALALIFAGWYYYERNKQKLPEPQKVERMVMPSERVGEIISVAAIFGIIGAKLADAFDNWDSFVADPIGTIFALSGLTYYGGLILAAVAVIVYGFRKNINILKFMDVAAPSLMVSYAVGRLGCQFSGDGDWGIPIKGPNRYIAETYEYIKPSWLPDWLWSQSYPHNVANDGVLIPGCEEVYCRQLIPEVFPTPIYEVAMCMAIFVFLVVLWKKLKTPGILFGVYLIVNGIERYIIEIIRVNDRKEFLGLNWSLSQYIAGGLVIAGILLIAGLLANKNRIKPYKWAVST